MANTRKIVASKSLKTLRDRLHRDPEQDGLAAALHTSRSNRRDMLTRFGFVPLSVLKINRGKLSRELFLFQHERGMLQARTTRVSATDDIASDAAKKRHAERVAAGVVGGGSVLDHKKSGSRLQVTIMPAELVEFFIKYYADAGQTYLDPFMGQGVQMQVAAIMGLNYIGFDVSKEYCRYIDAIAKKVIRKDVRVETHCHDARRMEDFVAADSCDFTFTSPPYWDVEFYGDEPEQLGKNDYPGFIDSMRDVARQMFRAFRVGGTAVINVNDIRKGGRFYPYHADLIAAFQSVGFQMHDIWIIDGLVGGLSKVFAVDRNLEGIAPKTHEYALVFRKPDGPDVDMARLEDVETARNSDVCRKGTGR